jgi:hypothetical protein
MRRSLCHLAVVAAALCGCEQDHVEVTVEPKPDGSFVRTLRMWRTDSQKKGEILAPSAPLAEPAKAHYAKRLETKDATIGLQGTFRTVPADLQIGENTNRGDYTVWNSRLGHVGYFRERRPGRIDHYTMLREAAEAIDLFVKLLAAITRQQLQGEQGLDKLVEFIEGPLRRDLKEALLLVQHASLTASAQLDKKPGHDPGIAVGAFLLQLAEERGYLQVADLPKAIGGKDAPDVAMAFVARQMGRQLDPLLRKRLASLAEPGRLEEARKAALDSLKIAPEEFDKAMKPIGNIIHLRLFATDPSLRYILVPPPQAELVYTNGQKDEKGDRLEWRDELNDSPVAALYFALWAVPDADWQTKHLGRVALRGEKLQSYVFWESSLTPDQLKAWSAAIERLDPKGDLEKQLSAIRVTPAAEAAQPEEGARLILEALKPAKD